jgi:hypothetical protein
MGSLSIKTEARKGLEKSRRILLLTSVGIALFRLVNPRKRRFVCPICGYNGPFADVHPETGLRRHAECPGCGARERHRLQYLVLEQLAETHDFSTMSMIHFAPEPFFESYFRRRFGQYESADLSMRKADHQVDMRCLPFEDEVYHFVFASHVLEHIPEDTLALSEISRVLKPGGIAVLPVPILGDETVEYPAPNPHESNHVRAPGADYFDRYAPYFHRVDRYDSHQFPEESQVFMYEDRMRWPRTTPLRLTTRGEKHADIVPVCFR